MNEKRLKKENEIMRKYIRWCRDYGFMGKDYLSPTQISDKGYWGAVKVIRKIKELSSKQKQE